MLSARPVSLALVGLASLSIAACAADRPFGVEASSPSLGKVTSPPDTLTEWLLPTTGYAMLGDAIPLYTVGGVSRYRNLECGVSSKVFATSTGDGTMQTNNPNFRDRSCASYPRKVTLKYTRLDGPADGSETIEFFANVDNIKGMVPGTTVTREMGINPTQATRCDALRFTYDRAGVVMGGDSVQVTRVDANTWTVTSRPDDVDPVTGQTTIHHDKAYCTTDGKLYHMPVYFQIRIL